MDIDHIFIFSDQQGREADQLVEFGLLEGSNRVHPGQGTANRKFYFENFFLEIVWVSNEAEVKSSLTSITRLWERSQFRSNGASRFGLGLFNTDDTDALFAHSLRYQPTYVSEEMAFHILPHSDRSYLPWTFRTPFSAFHGKWNEPMQHPNGIRRLTGLTFSIPDTQNDFTELLASHSIINFEHRRAISLTLEFDQRKTGRSRTFDALNLTLDF